MRRASTHSAWRSFPGDGLESAVSVASVLLLAEAIMTEIPDDKKEGTLAPEMTM